MKPLSHLVRLKPCAETAETAEQARELGRRLSVALDLLRGVQREAELAQSASWPIFSTERAFPVCLCEIVGRFDNWATKESHYTGRAIYVDPEAHAARFCAIKCDLALRWIKNCPQPLECTLQVLDDAIVDLEAQLREAEVMGAFDVGSAIAEIRRQRGEPAGTVVLKEESDPCWTRSYPHWKEQDVRTVELRPDGTVHACTYSQSDRYGSRPVLTKEVALTGIDLVRALRAARSSLE